MDIKNRFTDDIIFSFDGASLRGADLRGADLSNADFRGAVLRGVNFRVAALRGVNFRGAALSGADLSGADLRGAKLSHCSGNRSEIKSIFISDIYPITYTYDQLQIGCERHKISQWWEFDNKKILSMNGNTALKFWDKNKELIKMIIDSNPAKATGKEG